MVLEQPLSAHISTDTQKSEKANLLHPVKLQSLSIVAYISKARDPNSPPNSYQQGTKCSND